MDLIYRLEHERDGAGVFNAGFVARCLNDCQRERAYNHPGPIDSREAANPADDPQDRRYPLAEATREDRELRFGFLNATQRRGGRGSAAMPAAAWQPGG